MLNRSEFDHAPDADLDYGFNWQLLPGETVATSVWDAVEEVSLTRHQIAGGTTSVFVSGLIEGKVYTVTNTIETSTGRKDSRSLILSCKKRFPR